MKKIINIILLIMIYTMGINVYAKTPTLNEIAESFNNCKTVKDYAEYDSIMHADVEENKLIITQKYEETTNSYEYTLNNNILSITLDKDQEYNMSGTIVGVILTDSIGKLHGYEDGATFATLNLDDIDKYTIEKEGFEFKETENEHYTIKIDISKKIPIVDISKIYIKVSDLEDLKDFISKDGSAQTSKGNIILHKSGYDGEYTVIIAEKDKLTDNSYKSILSVLEVMFNNQKASNYFQANYSSLSNGNKSFEGIKIEVNPKKIDSEDRIIPDDSYKFVKLTIDKEKMTSAIEKYKPKKINYLKLFFEGVLVVIIVTVLTPRKKKIVKEEKSNQEIINQ